MSVNAICGLPGTGKTLYTTQLAIKHYNQQNNIIKVLIRKLKKEQLTINNVYSNYPILLDKKRNIYSNVINFNWLNMTVKLPKNSILIFDEIQRKAESMNYKEFDQTIATFLQHHRHADIKDIIVTSQTPNRININIRKLCGIFTKIRWSINILGIRILFLSDYYDFETYGMYHKTDKKVRNFDIKNYIRFINLHKTGNRYDSKYFSFIFEQLPPIENIKYTSKKMTEENKIDLEL